MADATPTVDVHLDAAAWTAARDAEVRRGLAATPKSLDPLWFYDEHGSALFDEITRLPEYYQTRAERSILLDHASEIAEMGIDTLVELGSGTSDKTTALLDAMEAAGTLERYVPVDVSAETLRAAAGSLQARYPNVAIHGVVGDFHRHLGHIPGGGRRLVAFLGGTIGNFRPAVRAGFYRQLAATLGPDDAFLIGIDLLKDPATIVAAYDDAAGVTAEFNRNALRVLNHELQADFDLTAFEHVARWSPEDRWIEMHLRTATAQQVRVEALDLDVALEPGESLLTEISAKFEPDAFAAELAAAGFGVERTWTSPGDEFALVFARPVGPG